MRVAGVDPKVFFTVTALEATKPSGAVRSCSLAVWISAQDAASTAS
jgi:hypothetical protein